METYFSCFCAVIATLQLSEAQHNMENVAVKKKCWASSIYSGSGFTNDCGAANNGDMNTRYVRGNCFHSDHGDQHPTWTVDLGFSYVIRWLDIYSRDGIDGLHRMKNVVISVDNKTIYQIKTQKRGTRTTISPLETPWLPIVGRYVSVSRQRYPEEGASDVFLNLCEVEVWVCLPGFYYTIDECVECPGCTGKFCDDITKRAICSDLCEPNPCPPRHLCQADTSGYSPYNCTLCQPGYAGDTCQLGNVTAVAASSSQCSLWYSKTISIALVVLCIVNALLCWIRRRRQQSAKNHKVTTTGSILSVSGGISQPGEMSVVVEYAADSRQLIDTVPFVNTSSDIGHCNAAFDDIL